MTIFTLEKTDGIAIVTMDDPSQPQNVLNDGVREDFERVFTQVREDSSLKGLIFRSGKPDCFLAGADIAMLQGIETFEQARDGSKLLHELMEQITSLPFTTVAAIGP